MSARISRTQGRAQPLSARSPNWSGSTTLSQCPLLLARGTSAHAAARGPFLPFYVTLSIVSHNFQRFIGQLFKKHVSPF